MTDQSVIDRKRAILDAALTVFSRKGYAATAVDDVAEEARIAKGTLYLYFKSKEALYLAALASDIRAMIAAGRNEMEKTDDLRDKLRAFLRVRMEYCRSRQEFLRIYLAEYGSLFVKTAPSRELVDLLQDNIRYVSTVIRRASRRGEIGPVPSGATAAALVDLSRGLMERRLLGWNAFRAPDEIEFSIDLLFSGIQNYAKSTAKRSKQASKREGRRVEVA